jgi:hypothetical protein
MRHIALAILAVSLLLLTALTVDARLIVSAASEDTVAAPGNREPNYIVVSVTDGNGMPTTGLAAANFEVDALIVAKGGALVDVKGVTQGRLPGFYIIDVLPIRQESWKRGVYIFAVAVKSGEDQGQALTTVDMD